VELWEPRERWEELLEALGGERHLCMRLHHHSICEENEELGSGQEGVLTISCEVPYFLELTQLQIRQLKEVNSDVASDLVVDLTSLPETL
jgi:hypothetical protein